MLTFKFGNETIVLNEHTAPNISAEIALRFNKLATKEMVHFRDDYRVSHVKVSNVASIVARLGQDCIGRGVDTAIDVLLEKGIFDYDAARFMDQNSVFLFTSREAYCSQMQGLSLLNEKERQQQAARTAQRAGRSRWEGGGFGVKGAIKGAATAGAMNAVTDIFRGISDFSKDSEKAEQFMKKKQEYIQSAGFIDCLAMDVSNCIKHDVKNRLFSILSDHIPDFAVSETTDSQQATALFNNLPRLNAQQQQKVLAQAIQLEPHNWKYIQYAYDNMGTLGVSKEDIDHLAQFFDQEAYSNASGTSATRAFAAGLDRIEQIPFNLECYSNEVMGIAKKYGSNLDAYIREMLAVAVKYSLLDDELNVLPKITEELAPAYQTIFGLAAIEIVVAFDCVADYTKKTNYILFSPPYSIFEKQHIIFSILSKYHLTEGDENDFRLDSNTINRMKQLPVSDSKQYKFIIQLTDKLSALRDCGIIFRSNATGIEYLREMCTEKAVQSTFGIIGAPIDKNTKKLVAFRGKCNIPENDNVFVLGDTTILGSGKKGFALTTSGFYHNQNKDTEYWDWETFAQKKIEPLEDGFSIGEVRFCITSDAIYSMLSILISMQKDVQGESHPVTHDVNDSN